VAVATAAVAAAALPAVTVVTAAVAAAAAPKRAALFFFQLRRILLNVAWIVVNLVRCLGVRAALFFFQLRRILLNVTWIVENLVRCLRTLNVEQRCLTLHKCKVFFEIAAAVGVTASILHRAFGFPCNRAVFTPVLASSTNYT